MKPGKELLFLALGGSDEIGMNVNLYGCQGKWLMVDLGVTFADHQYPGIDLVLPDLSFIEERSRDLLGIVITHGHEDHIGSLPYLAADLDVPIYATDFTARLIRGKLEEEGLRDVRIEVIESGGAFALGPFACRYVPMAHSIPEMQAVVIDTPYGRVFHSGDWKLDETPVIGRPAGADALAAIGDEGVLALVCDSTNAFNAEAAGSEGSVAAGLLSVVSDAKGRVLVTTFASNAARLHTLGEVARQANRKLCVAGRSLDRIIGVARASGYLKGFPETVDFEAAMRVPPAELMIIATGGQGEPNAALGRIAAGIHPLKLGEGDLVIFSSKQIPGNEVAIGVIQNQLARSNIPIVTEKQAHVHVSGHPGRPELAQLYKWLRPEILIPVHGERRHMAEQARFAAAQGVPRPFVQSNGDVVRLAPDGPAVIGREKTGRLVLDGDIILPANGATINDRRRIALNGLVSVALALDERGRPRGRPQIAIHGLPVEEDRDAFLDEACDAADAAAAKGARDEEAMREAIRLAVRRSATDWTGKKPVVAVQFVRV